jgi:hypothetical protein
LAKVIEHDVDSDIVRLLVWSQGWSWGTRVYDTNKSTSTMAIEATRGSFRFVTGSQGKGNVQVKTPYGTLGVRG